MALALLRLRAMNVAAPHMRARLVKRYTTAFLFLVVFGLFSTNAFGQQTVRLANNPYDELLVNAARRYRLDIFILRAQMNQESGNRPAAISPKGARGLMQLMPATAARFGVTNVFDPAQSIEGGARYMRWLLDLFGENYTLALAAYNAGEGAVLKYGRTVPPYAETQQYVASILNRARLIRASSTYPIPSLQVASMSRNTSVRRGNVPAEIAADAPSQANQPPPKVETSSRYFFQ